MAPNINWKNHFIELPVAIIGISIAFSLNNWKEIPPFVHKNVRFTGRPIILNRDFLKDNFFRNKSYPAYYSLDKKFGSHTKSIEKAEALINKIRGFTQL